MRSFTYERPDDLGQATRLLAEAGADARVLAGGTDLIVGLRDGSITPKVVLDIKWIEQFTGPSLMRAGDVLRFNALATMGQVEHDPTVLEHMPALAEAARVVGSVQIRNRATLAGNICNGSPAADTAPPLLVYGATVVVAGPHGERRVGIDDFITGPKRTGLRSGELVVGIEVPIPGGRIGAAYTRLVRRRGTDLASVTLCASVDGAGVTQLAYGSVGPRAFLVTDRTGVLADLDAAPQARTAVLDRLLAQAAPSVRSLRAGPEYRLAMLRVLAMRAVETAISRRAAAA